MGAVDWGLDFGEGGGGGGVWWGVAGLSDRAWANPAAGIFCVAAYLYLSSRVAGQSGGKGHGWDCAQPLSLAAGVRGKQETGKQWLEWLGSRPTGQRDGRAVATGGTPSIVRKRVASCRQTAAE